jgi:dolichol-phosphate mannosyltransferase
MNVAPPAPITKPRIVAIPVAFNEERAIADVCARFRDVEGVDLAVADDGSTDRTPEIVRQCGVTLLRVERQCGVGSTIRRAYFWAKEQGYDICVVMSGNDKDRPSEIPRLVGPIVEGRADLVQGSRYLDDGRHENMPKHRLGASQVVHPLLFRLASGRRITDTTNGFRALRLSLLDDARFRLEQSWLDHYELEPWLLLEALRLGYAVLEVPVTKVYPPAGERYTQMRPLVDWWSIVRPIVYFGLRWKR